MLHRYYCDSAISDSHVEIGGPEAHHMINVLRLNPRERVVLFDGSGCEFEAEIVQINRGHVNLNILEKHSVSRELASRIIVACAIPKGNRQKWLVEKLVEIGVTELQPIRTRRSVVDLDAKGVDRLTRNVIEASKQCGRNQLMNIRPMADLADVLAAPHDGFLRVMAHQQADPASSPENPHEYVNTIVCVGPEGGWTVEELQLAREHGWHTLSLGPAVLRMETAAMIAAARFRERSH